MIHKVRDELCYAVLPESKYGLSKYQPSKVMDESDYTLFTKVRLMEQSHDDDGGIIARPGKHSGFFFSNDQDGDGGYLKFLIWVRKDGVELPLYKDVKISKDQCKEWLLIHSVNDLQNKRTDLFVNGELKHTISHEEFDERVKYEDEPYYIGCGNPFSIDPKFRNHGNFEYDFVGLVDKVISEDEIKSLKDKIIKHPTHGLNIIDPKDPISKNVVFYFDFENISRYRIWDVSNNSNHLNLHVTEEDRNDETKEISLI